MGNYERNRMVDQYVDWCEQNDLDPRDDHWDEFEKFLDGLVEVFSHGI